MGYSQLKELKKVQDTSFEKEYVRTLVYIQDLYDLIAYQGLREKLGSEVRFISDVPLVKEAQLVRGPTSFRGEAALKVLAGITKKEGLALRDAPALFYKDSDWKDFEGRAKSEKLLAAEEYFTRRGIDFDPTEFFPFLSEDTFWTSIEEQRLSEKVVNIKSQTPTDMISPVNWALECGSGKVLECEELIFGGSPQTFLDLIGNKKSLSDEFVEFCESTRSPCELIVKFDFSGVVHPGSETFFIPLSYTHEWGHFIGEFKGHEAQFLHFFEGSETSEEEVSKKLKLLKRNLEKIFPEFSTKYCGEFLVVRQESGCLNIDDSIYDKIQNKPAHLKFVHRNAPLSEESLSDISFGDSMAAVLFDARALYSCASVGHCPIKKEQNE